MDLVSERVNELVSLTSILNIFVFSHLMVPV